MEPDSCRQRLCIVSHVRASNREEQSCKITLPVKKTQKRKRDVMHRQLKIVSQKEQSNEDALKIIPGNDFNLNYV